MKPLICIASFIGLGACGGGGSASQDVAPDPPITLSAEQLSLLRTPEGVTFEIRPDDVIVRLGDEVSYLDLEANPPSDQFRKYSGSRGSGRLLIGDTPSESARAFLLFASGTNGIGASGTRLVRLTDTTVPTRGAATYLGEYAGSYGGGGFNVSGDVRLTADFQQSLISGGITNRQLAGANIGGRPAEHLVLAEATIVDGAFSGDISGGRDLFLTQEPTGSYEGMIVGENGEGAIGAVRVVHNNGDEEPAVEWGLFLAAE